MTIVVALINLLVIAMAVAVEFWISIFYLGAESNPDRGKWLLNALVRFLLSLVVALLCSAMQYSINKDIIGRRTPDSPVLAKKISYTSFIGLAILGLYFSLRFFFS